MDKKWKKVGAFIGNLDIYLTCVLLVFLVGLTFTGVFARYLFSAPIVWQEEVQLAVFLWIAFLGGSAAFRTNGHVAIELIVDNFPEKIRKVVEILVAVIVVVVLAYLLRNAGIYMQTLVKANRESPILRIPYVIIYSILPICSFLMIVNQIYAIIVRYFVPKKTETAQEGDAE